MIGFEIAFWTSLVLVFYTFAGYPLLIGSLAAARSRSRAQVPLSPPTVTVVLCVHNEESRIVRRLENLMQSDYPAEQLKIQVVSDGSTDNTNANVTAFRQSEIGRRVQLLALEVRSGKASGLNRALAGIRSELVVFADARQSFAPETLRRLVDRFADARVGAVSGSLEIERASSNTGAGVDVYWRLEKFVRRSESAFGTTIGCTGAVYAIRRALFRPLPADTLLDDVLVPMEILNQGYRVEFEPRAVAFDPQSLEPERERIRKKRTLAGNYQLLFRYPEWLLPWKNRAWWQLASHKYLRLAAPWFLLTTLAANLALTHVAVYRWTLAGQVSLYLLAFWGLGSPQVRFKAFSIPAGFVFLNSMVVAGLFHYLRCGGAAWQKGAPSLEP